VDSGKVKVYMKNFGEFYNNQVETASTIILSRTDSIPQQKLDNAVKLLREHNEHATIVTTPWGELTGTQLLEAMEGNATLAADLAKLEEEHHHHHHDHDDHCCCGHDHEEHHHHHHEHDDHCCCGHDHEEHHHHHDHDDHCCCDHDHEEHHHHHDHDDHCCCGHDHHHHHADEVFTSWGVETAKKFTQNEVHTALLSLDSGRFGVVLRAKGIVPCTDGGWIHFDFVPGEADVRMGSAAITGKLCVIGAQLDESGVAKLFGV